MFAMERPVRRLVFRNLVALAQIVPLCGAQDNITTPLGAKNLRQLNWGIWVIGLKGLFQNLPRRHFSGQFRVTKRVGALDLIGNLPLARADLSPPPSAHRDDFPLMIPTDKDINLRAIQELLENPRKTDSYVFFRERLPPISTIFKIEVAHPIPRNHIGDLKLSVEYKGVMKNVEALLVQELI